MVDGGKASFHLAILLCRHPKKEGLTSAFVQLSLRDATSFFAAVLLTFLSGINTTEASV